MVQITPFNVHLKQGAKLTFPNTDHLLPNTLVKLYRYDQSSGEFVQEPVPAKVSADGLRIETASNAIKVTSYYLVGFPAPTSLEFDL